MNTISKILTVVLLAGAVAGTLVLKERHANGVEGDGGVAELAARETSQAPGPEPVASAATAVPSNAAAPSGLPRLVDLGADKCIPCKMMAPILESLKEEYAGKLDVQFIDVWKNPDAAKAYGVEVIPTQVFYAASGEELFRHTGFIGKEDLLAQWGALGVELGALPENTPAFSRWEPAEADTRPKDRICYLCDGDIPPESRAVMKTSAGDVAFCSVHCYLITYASMTEANKTHGNASVTEWPAGALVPVTGAAYLYGVDGAGRPSVKAFADEAAAKEEQGRAGGSVLAWAQLEAKEMAIRCGFCGRPVYADDATAVRAAGIQTQGCCVMCALGVAARSGQDIEVEAKDALTGAPVRVTTFSGHVATLEPDTAVAWAGAFKDNAGQIKSAGCFKQAFFANPANLHTWVEKHPTATGRQVRLEEALAEKMKLTPEQIDKACKIGACAPK